MKAFLAPEVRKSVPKFAFAFSKSDFLDLIDFNFLDLAKFITIDRFSILLSIPPPSASLAALSASRFPA